MIFVIVKMSNQTHGVQQLLMAEKRAADKVSGARRRKYNLDIFFLGAFNNLEFILRLVFNFSKSRA